MNKLNTYQKILLILMLVVVAFFTFVYRKTIFTVGYLHEDTILVPSVEGENEIYSGEIDGKQAKFVVSNGNTVEFYYGDKYFGPYIVSEDETAIPEKEALAEHMRGVEISCNDRIIFRGGTLKTGGHWLFYGENGNVNMGLPYVELKDGKAWDINGQEIDPMEPTIHTIFELLEHPELTHKGNWGVWFAGVLICFVNVISMVFADVLFRMQLRYQIRNVEDAEPSDWEMASRYVTWTLMPILAVVVFVFGLKF